ncbi:MAG TPA: 4'-phosphopantetheinyl transferase superfamily protein [Candidatus Eisenbacteria bacterium]|jgi:phosphopantetheinyl transferase (holo-ACP synthase)|nr:4'-phosphopantetheinyl transferase superfamily protein [Candidatus Eisenbacteria bacterium]
MRPAENHSLGVDLVEYEKASDLYRNHRHRLGTFLNRSESRYLSAKGLPPEKRLAEVLAAKEALFKAAGGSWMGVSGFAKIALTARGGRLRPAGATSKRYRFRFLRADKYVVAHCEKICAGT